MAQRACADHGLTVRTTCPLSRSAPERPAASLAPRAPWALLLALTLVLGVASSAAAQDREEVQLWSAILATASTTPAPPGLAFWLDVHARRGDPSTVALVRPGVGAEIFSWLSVWGGYAWIPNANDETGETTHEHRIWQQVVLSHGFDEPRVSIQSRTRFEQRFSDRGSDVGLRLRQFVRLNWSPVPDVPVGLALWDEIFVGLTETDWGAPTGVDQNRFFVGPFLALAGWARLEAGYLFAYLDRGASDLYAHVIAVNLFVSPRPPAPPPEEEPLP